MPQAPILCASRRGLLAGGLAWGLAGSAAAATAHQGSPGHAAPGLSPAQALQRLMAGNARFAQGRPLHAGADVARRRSLAGGQHPFAAILACADSRVAPELIFDQGLGELFVVRVAGNVVDDAVLASLEYSVIHLGSPLVMVLGHERCGAVTATLEALDGKASPEDRETRIGALAALIAPAVRAVPAKAADRLDAAIVLNAERAAHAVLAGSPPLRSRAQAGSLKVVSARYDLDDGTISHLRDARA